MRLLALLLLGQLNDPSVVSVVRGPGEISLNAEQIIHRDKEKLTVAEGNAELRTDDSALSADQIAYDGEKQVATGIGHVTVRLLKGGQVAALADVATLKLDHNQVTEVFLQNGSAYRKKGIAPAAFLEIRDAEALKAAGITTFMLTANHLAREGDDWKMENADLVPCECDWAHPNWGIRAGSASIDPKSERATLTNATVRVHDIPILWIPWINLPLEDHASGLLAPKPSFTALSGFSLEQPVFWAPARSYDFTFTPGYFFGNGRDQQYGVSGPRLMAEARWAPVQDMFGRVQIGLIDDLNFQRDPVDPTQHNKQARGLRYEAVLQHRQRLSGDWYARVDASLLSDGYYFRDITSDVLAREASYQRSSASVYRRTEDSWLGFDVVLRQDLNWGYPVFGAPQYVSSPGSIPERGPATLQRLPAFTLAIPERPLAGPLTFSLTGGFVRLAPAFGITGDEGSQANEGRPLVFSSGVATALDSACQAYWLYNPGTPPAGCMPPDKTKLGEGDGRWQPGEREARDRLDLFPRLAASLGLGDVARLTPYAGWRQDVWFGEASSTLTQRGYGIVGARVDSELARTFGDSWRHTIAPAIEVRGVPFAYGTQPGPYDELDTSIPMVTTQLQAVAELRQRLLFKSGGVAREVARLELWQGFDLLNSNGARVGESMGRVTTRYGYGYLSALARVDFPNHHLSRLSTQAGLDSGKGDGLYAGYENIAFEGTDRTRLPLDMLVGTPPPGLAIGNSQSISFGGRVRFKGFGLRYDALFLDQGWPHTSTQDPKGNWVSGPLTNALTFAQHSVGVSYGPACECWRIEVAAIQRPKLTPTATGPYYGGVPDFGATLTIQNFGTFGVAR